MQIMIFFFKRKKNTNYEQLDFRYTSLVLKNNIIKEQYYLGTIINKNTLPYLKNTVEWQTLKKNKDLWVYARARENKIKKDFCEEFEKESEPCIYEEKINE